jgi:hypothetical protein
MSAGDIQEVIKTIAWAVVFIVAIFGGTFCYVARLCLTGRALFERQTDRDRPSNVTRLASRESER